MHPNVFLSFRGAGRRALARLMIYLYTSSNRFQFVISGQVFMRVLPADRGAHPETFISNQRSKPETVRLDL